MKQPSPQPHAHPCNFRLTRVLDRGWGEMAFEYRWDSSSGLNDEEGIGCPDLAHCSLYEITTYAGNIGMYVDGYFFPPDPPFVGWKFRDPTDGRTAPVALGCFPASQGWAWDRHKLGGRLRMPEPPDGLPSRILARQQYRFQCQICAMDAIVPGSESGPHAIVRAFAPLESVLEASQAMSSLASNRIPNPRGRDARPQCLWRYTLHKHCSVASLDIDANGYVDDSAHIGFGPHDLG